MTEMAENDDEIFKLELAASMPAKDENFSDWAINNPEAEYGLWMTARYPEDRIEDEMLKRVRNAERAPSWVIARACIVASIGVALDGMIVEQTIRDGRIGNAIIVGALSLVLFSSAREILREQLPQARSRARQERELFERGMQARTLAKMMLPAEG